MADLTIPFVIQAILVCLGVTGFFLARFLKNKKTEKKRLVCPLRSDCTTVIRSRYSRFAGMPVERIGMLYYMLVAVFYAANILSISGTEMLFDAALWVSGVAFAFSIYLVMVQIFAIRQFCFWCLCSAMICLMIFGGTMVLHGLL